MNVSKVNDRDHQPYSYLMLPQGWSVKYSKSHNNRPYYFNETTGVTQWDPPTSPNTSTNPSKTKVHVYHLLVKHSGSRRPSSWRQEQITCTESEALEEIRAIRAEIYASELGVFEALKEKAAERSDCSSAKRGGDLGYFGPGEMQSKETTFNILYLYTYLYTLILSSLSLLISYSLSIIQNLSRTPLSL